MQIPKRRSERDRLAKKQTDRYLTADAIAHLQRDLADLKERQRPRLAEEVRRTSEMGDRSENAGYQAAKAQLVIYLAKSQKSVAAYDAYTRARRDVEELGNIPVPLHLRNAPTKLMKELEYGKGYKYSPKENSSAQTYLPPELEGRSYVE